MKLNKLLKKEYEEIDLRLKGKNPDVVSSNINDLDSMFYGGLQRGSLSVIAGRYAMGKSSFALTLACNIAEIHDLSVCFFKLDDCKENLTRSFITHKTGINFGKLRNGKFSKDEKLILDKSFDALGKLPINIFDNPFISVKEIKKICNEIKNEVASKKLGLVVIENLQLLEYFKLKKSGEDYKFNIAESLKSLAKELNVPVIVFSQIDQEVELRENKRPQTYDIKDFEEITHQADAIIMLYRDDYYNFDSKDKGITEVILRKNKYGPTGMFYMFLEAQYKKFSNSFLKK